MTYKFTVDLASPVASSNPVLHADGPLQYAKALQEIGRDGINELDPDNPPQYFDLPLVKERAKQPAKKITTWIWRCSALHPVVESDAWNATKWRKRFDVDLDHQKKDTQINKTAGKYKSYNATLPYTHASKLVFYADTKEPEKIMRLLKSLKGIGKKTSQGYGKIQDISFEQSSVDPVLHDETMMRHVPVEFFTSTNGENHGFAEAKMTAKRIPTKPPYWHADNHEFGVPAFTDLNEKAQELYDEARNERLRTPLTS